MNKGGPILDALNLPRGARFYRCALQVNPFEYVLRHGKATTFADESHYNDAIIEACLANGIEVIGITDHQRCDTGRTLAEAARHAGLIVFPGAELETKEGVHFLLLFDPTETWERCNGVLGDCGIHDQNNPPRGIHYDVHELLERSLSWRCGCIAAHVASEKGLLRVLDGQARADAWKSRNLLACSLPGPVDEAPDNLRPIILNKNIDYRRDRPVAVLNAQDIADPADFAKPAGSCWIKMSDVSVEGLRQAFLDPESRVRLSSDPVPEEHTEFLGVVWQGGFLDGAAVHFNENLNVLIGGRGTGKSTVIESLRYVLGLEPLGEDARRLHDGIVRSVLRSGTKISLLIRSHQPSRRDYLIERTVPNPPVVRDEDGQVLNLKPADIIPQVEVYGQHEISELTKSPEKLTRLLDRFVTHDPDMHKRRKELQRQLERSRNRLLDLQKELLQISEQLAKLPALEDTLRSYQKAGLEDKLKEQSLLVREERVLRTADERIEPFEHWLSSLDQNLPIDRAFLTDKALDGLAGKKILKAADPVLADLSHELEAVVREMRRSLERARKRLADVRVQWEQRKQTVQADYEAILRDLQKSRIDGEEFIRLRRQIEGLRPLKERKTSLEKELKAQQAQRRNLLVEWEDVKAEAFRQLERAAKQVNRKLKNRVLVQVTAAGNREPLAQLLRERVGGRLSEAIDALKKRADFSLPAFTEACRLGRDALSTGFDIPQLQAERITGTGSDVIMEIEELILPPTTAIKLNVAGEGQEPQWQDLEQLSTGQKATAVLLLLLLESQAPLIVDQPEDDLDNRFITEGIVPKMREEKRIRQFVFATHNANIPVLGDAELIVGLSASGEADQGLAKLPAEHMASIDNALVSELVKEILEGGRDAFEMRRMKYGF